jgi:hypothetical protein
LLVEFLCWFSWGIRIVTWGLIIHHTLPQKRFTLSMILLQMFQKYVYVGCSGNTPHYTQDTVWFHAWCWCSYSIRLIGNKYSKYCFWAQLSQLVLACVSCLACLFEIYWINPSPVLLIHIQPDRELTSPYEFMHFDILPTPRDNDSPLVMLVWVHHLVCYLSAMVWCYLRVSSECSVTMYTVTAGPWTGFIPTCLMYRKLSWSTAFCSILLYNYEVIILSCSRLCNRSTVELSESGTNGTGQVMD